MSHSWDSTKRHFSLPPLSQTGLLVPVGTLHLGKPFSTSACPNLPESRPGSNTSSFMRPLLSPRKSHFPSSARWQDWLPAPFGVLLPSMHGCLSHSSGVCDGAVQGPTCYPQSTRKLLLPHKASSWFYKAQSCEGCIPRKTAVPGEVHEQEQGPGLLPVSGHSTPSLSCQRQKQGTDHLKSGA